MAFNITYDHQIFSWQKYGGISRYFFELSNQLHQGFDCNVQIIAPFYICSLFSDKSLIRPKGIKIPKLHPLITNHLIQPLNRHLSECHFSNIDIFHKTYYDSFPGLPSKTNKIITIYDMTHEIYANTFPKTDNTSQLKARSVSEADHIICISQNTKVDFLRYFPFAENKTSVVYLGEPKLKAVSAFTKDKFRKPYILYVGERFGYKNFDGLVKAYAHSSRLQNDFLLICFGGGTLRPYELALISSLKIPKNRIIHLSGTDAVLSNLYSSAAVFVYPSFYEGFGMPPLEAMSFSCPVACSNRSSLPEIVGQAAEMFNPAQVDEIAHAIENIVFSSDRTNSLIQHGKKQIESFSWNRCAQETLNIYKNI